MRFVTKVWGCAASAAIVACSTLGYLNVSDSSHMIREQFDTHYEALASNIASSFLQMERVTDTALLNAVRVYQQIEEAEGPGTASSLAAITKVLGVQALGFFDAGTGVVELCSGFEEGRGTLNFFDLAPSYYELVRTGALKDPILTPFAPNAVATSIGQDAEKYVYLLSRDASKVLGASYRSTWMSDYLQRSLLTDDAIKRLAFETPSGEDLAYVGEADIGSPDIMEFYVDMRPSTAWCDECVQKGLVTTPGAYVYTLRMHISTHKLKEFSDKSRNKAIVVAAVVCMLIVMACRPVASHLLRGLRAIATVARKVVETNDLMLTAPVISDKDEVSDLARAFNSMLTNIRENEAMRVDLESSREILKHSAQVAHDIRSPLAALGTVLGDATDLKEDIRILVRNSVNRIQDIANGLLQKRRGEDKDAEECVVLLPSLLETIVSEKRAQFRSRLNLSITCVSDGHGYGAFAQIHPGEFKRVVSNLVNNAAEALPDGGEISISVTRTNTLVTVHCADNGVGMPPEVLARLGKEGVSHGKAAGNGLGVRHAFEVIASWGGTLRFESQMGQGTTAAISLPLATEPGWFVPCLNLGGVKTVIVLDDDASIHDVWKERLSKIIFKSQVVKHCGTAEEFRKAFSAKDVSSTLFLLDYELIGSDATGLELILEYALHRRAMLVTSRFEDRDIVDCCLASGIGLIPKAAVSEVPITRAHHDAEPPEAVLIDDDALIRMVWMNAAKKEGKRLACFADKNSFLRARSEFSKETVLFIDSNLGENVPGEDLARELFDEGFRKLHLCTGYDKARFKGMPWLASIRGKEPPPGWS